MDEYQCALAPFLTSYVEFKRRLGYKLEDTSTFRNLDRLVRDRSVSPKRSSHGGAIAVPMKVIAPDIIESLR